MIQLPAEFRPMLSAAIRKEQDFKKLQQWPYLVSPKLDGIRVFIHPTDGAVTRTMKPIRNRHIQSFFQRILAAVPEFACMDGEIIFGAPLALTPVSSTVFQDTTSAVMSFDGEPEVTLWVFDQYFPDKPNMPYMEREKAMAQNVDDKIRHFLTTTHLPHPRVHIEILPCEPVGSKEEILDWEQKWLEKGFEGLMLRNIDRPYRYGRSSLHGQQQHLIKLKRTEDSEAVIIGFEELMHNDNPDEKDAFGLAKRSSAKGNLKPANTLGSLLVRAIAGDFQGKEFAIGSGFDQSLRDTIWRQRDAYLGRTVSFKYQAQGIKDLPRFPIFKGFREDI